jgi:hypothetical protein
MGAAAHHNGRVNARHKAAYEHKQKAQNYFGVP